MKKKFYSVHVFYSRNDGYSVPVMIETDEEFLTDDQVIDHVVINDLLNYASDANQIDCIDEIDENEYNLMKD
jgi:hypothetical protein